MLYEVDNEKYSTILKSKTRKPDGKGNRNYSIKDTCITSSTTQNFSITDKMFTREKRLYVTQIEQLDTVIDLKPIGEADKRKKEPATNLCLLIIFKFVETR